MADVHSKEMRIYNMSRIKGKNIKPEMLVSNCCFNIFVISEKVTICDILVGGKSNPLVPGDYFAIPLHEYHTVKVTSRIVCKAILQRVAA